MIYTLVVILCLRADASRCQSYEQVVDLPSASPSSAFIEGQAVLAQWMGAHPDERIARWRLAPGRSA